MAKNEKGKTSKVEIESTTTRDDLVDILKTSLNKDSDGNIAFTLTDKDDPATIVDWVSTGVTDLDLAISNRKHGGIPCGRITEITGLEASGKSLLGSHFLAEIQRKGGLAVFIDTETSVDHGFLAAIGVDLNNLLYINVDTVEDIFDTIEKIIAKIRASSKDKLVGILVDSVAGASSKTEMESEHGKDGYATAKAIIISKAMRKITNMIAKQKVALVFTNQLRQNLNAGLFGEKYCVNPYTTKIKIKYKI
jgi:recombination protein RecA